MSNVKLVNIARLMTTYNLEIEQLPENLKCAQCKLVLKDACQLPCCCRYCRVCIDGMMAKGGEFCPGGMEECGESALSRFVSDYASNNGVSRLTVKCPKIGCVHECRLAKIEEHLRECKGKHENCPFGELGCTQEKLVAEEMGRHLQCENRRHSEILIETIANINREIEMLKRRDEASSGEIEILKQRDVASRGEIEKLKQRDETSSREIETLKQRDEASSREIEKLKLRDEASSREIETLKRKNENNSGEIEKLKQKDETSSREIEKLKLRDEASSKDIETLKRKDEDNSGEIEKLKQKDETSSREIEILKLRDEASSKDIETLKRKDEDNSGEIEKLKQKDETSSREIEILKLRDEASSKDIETLKRKDEDNSGEIEKLKQKDETSSREIEKLKLIDEGSSKDIETLKDWQIRSIMDQMIHLENENISIKNDIKSIKEGKEDLADRVRILTEKVERQIVAICENHELDNSRVMEHVDREIAAVTQLIGYNKDDLVTEMQSVRGDIGWINQGVESMKNDICSVKLQSESIQALVGLGQFDASCVWLININIGKNSWEWGNKQSEYFNGAVHPYKYRLTSSNYNTSTAVAALGIQLLINAGPNDGHLAWPFEARVVVTVTDRDRREACRSISLQCRIERPQNDGCRSSEAYEFIHYDLIKAGLNLSRGVRVSCEIVPKCPSGTS